jgi:glyoxylase-like metal-dependent hydrolase (beta-lactamase superfamily II)
MLRRNIGTYVNYGGTIACLLTPDHGVVVDTQLVAQATDLLGKIRQTRDQPFDLLVNTHHHEDHTTGNGVFRPLVKTHVAHENAKANQIREAIANNQLDSVVLPTTTFVNKWSQRVGDETVTLHHFGPGHTNGDAVVHFEEANVVHVGDLVFNRRFPFVDRSAGADIGAWIAVLHQIRHHFDADTLYIFGHTSSPHPVTGTGVDLEVMAHFLQSSLEYIEQQRRAGTTLEQLLATTTAIPGAPDFRGEGIERILRAGWVETGSL